MKARGTIARGGDRRRAQAVQPSDYKPGRRAYFLDPNGIE
jgi:hypothetical protein